MNGYKFRRQVPIGRYIADFVCHEVRLIVEIDGGQHDHSAPREAERSEFLANEGYRILRFWNDEVLTSLAGVRPTIADTLAASPLPRTSPIEGEGVCIELPPPAHPPPKVPLGPEGGQSRDRRCRMSHNLLMVVHRSMVW